MARVSQEHLDARRRQIIDGAARCFARDGFHGASMQGVLKEVGLSAGAVYRYFSGKEDLIAAIADEAFTSIRRAFWEAADATPPPAPDVLLGRVLRGLFSGEVCGLDGRQFASLIVQVWSESLRNEQLAATFEDGYGAMRVVWTGVVEGYREAGILRADVPADHVARTMMAATQGFFAQMALFGDADPAVLENGMRGLMAMDRPETG
ncbi:TetR/AcrR family transcriptional regulator [Streptomyces sp. NPDC007164]|uniref:TetR/AcrR family transcriptional regulator n=1 Tax=Streptomyces sp. NPDC007164 TaxID=3156918 RepID=UPI0033E9A5D4